MIPAGGTLSRRSGSKVFHRFGAQAKAARLHWWHASGTAW